MQEYIRVGMKITEFDAEDIITTSGGSSSDSSDTVILPTPDEDYFIWGKMF